MTTLGNPARGSHKAALDASRCIYSTRKSIAKMINAQSASCIAFTSNATEALNIAISGLISNNDHVITTVCEHNSVLRPLYNKQKSGTQLDFICVNEKGVLDYDNIEKMIEPHTKALIVSHASNVTGNVVDLSILTEIKKKYGLLLIIDAAQSMGNIAIDVQKNDIDILCFTGHKELLGPQGTGGIYVSPNINLPPFKRGGSGIHSYDEEQPSKMPESLEAGTLNCHGIAGLNAAIEYINELGIDYIHSYTAELAMRFYEGIRSIESVKIYGDIRAELRTPIVSLNIGDLDSATVNDLLNTRYDICVRSGAHCAPLMHKALGTDKSGVVRFSFGISNTADEVDTAVNAIAEISEEYLKNLI